MKKNEIQPQDIWNEEKLHEVVSFIKGHSETISNERKIRNKLLSIKYKIEDYIEKEDVKETGMLSLLDFVKMYLKIFDITKKDLAKYFEMEDSNLHKYLTGERKLNSEIVLKISSFSHTNPEYWYRIQLKNEIVKLRNEEMRKYDKYDYRNLLSH
jgi:plasmid maintenance system antidote protein VapI